MSKPKKKLVKPTSYYERKAAGKALFIPTTEEVAARYKAQWGKIKNERPGDNTERMTEDQFNTYRELGELKAKVKGVPIPPEIYNSARQIKYNIDNHHRYRVPPNTDALGNEFAQGHTNKFYTTPTKDDLRNGYNAAQSIQNHEFNHFVFTNTKGDGDKLKQSFSPAEEGKAYAGLSAKGKRRTKAYFDAQNGVEYRARVGQIMDFLEFKADPKGGIINRFGEKELTKGALRYAKKNYIKEVGIDNNMQDFFDRMIDEDNVVKWANDHIVDSEQPKVRLMRKDGTSVA